MSQFASFSKILKEVAGNLAKVYPYVAVLYIAALAGSYFYKSLNEVFYWPGFHGIMAALTTIMLLSGQARNLVKSRMPKFSRDDYLKIFAILLLVGLAVYFGRGTFPEYAILAYALICLLWGLSSNIPAGLALVLLLVCAVASALKAPIISNISAIYAFYFLVIAVLTQIREYRKSLD